MATTKFSVSAYTADGVTTDYLITWDYLDSDHIAVYVDGTPNYDPQSTYSFELINSTTVRVTDEFGNAVPSGSEIEIRRETPILDRAVTFNDGSALLAEDLNKNSDYLLYSMQEVLDTVEAAAQDGALAAQVATEELRDQTEVLRATTEGYKNETLTARNTTQTYLATVDADATAADNHRIAAAASEAAALASQNAAAASQAASATSEANAAASEAASAASEAAAAVSEANAATSAAAALASENAAEAAQGAAEVARVAAEAALDELTDLYLGAKTTAPTVDNDGNALQTGALYWNSTNDIMYVWNGTTWDTFNSTAGVADSATSSKVFISDANVGINTSNPESIATATIEGAGTIAVLRGGGGPFQGLAIKNTYASSSQTANVFIDALNENNVPVANMYCGINSDGGSAWAWMTQPPGDRTDRRVERLRIQPDGKVGMGVSDPAESLSVRTYGNAEISAQYGTGLKAKLGAYASATSVTLPTASTHFDIASETGGTDTMSMRAYYNGTWRWGMKMDPEGRVQFPSKPMCSLNMGGGWRTLYVNNSYGVGFSSRGFQYNQGGFYWGGSINGIQVVHVPISGYYRVTLQSYVNSGTQGRLEVRRNGYELIGFSHYTPTTDDKTSCLTATHWFNAQDYLTYYVWGNSVNLFHETDHTELQIEFVG